jgi:hypothetical protein
MKISVGEHIERIREQLQQIYAKLQAKQAVSEENYKFLGLLQREAIAKISSDFKEKKAELLMQSESLSEKEQRMVDFVFVALEGEALVNTQNAAATAKENGMLLRESRKYWHYFIAWLQVCSQFPPWKQYISRLMQAMTHRFLEVPRAAIQVVKILIETEGGISDEPRKES